MPTRITGRQAIPRPTQFTTTMVAIVAVTTALVSGACASNADNASSATAAAGSSAEGPQGDDGSDGGNEGDSDFDAELATVDSRLDALDGDMCDLVKVFELRLHRSPTTSEQVRRAVDATVRLLDAIAAVAPDDDEQVFADTAKQLRDEALDHEHSTEWFSSYADIGALATEDFVEATTRFRNTLWDQCMEDDQEQP